MYKKDWRRMPKKIKKDFIKSENIRNDPLYSLKFKNPQLSEAIEKALASIEYLPSYWLVYHKTNSGRNIYVVFERYLSEQIEKEVLNKLETLSKDFSFIYYDTSISKKYSIY